MGRRSCPTTQVWQKAPLPHIGTLLQLLAEKMIMVLGIGRSLSSLYLANGFSVSHQQGQYFPIGFKWVSVLVVWIANILGPVYCADMWIQVQNLTLKHKVFQHNWMMLSANSVTVSRANLHHNLGYTAASPMPLECKANNAWWRMQEFSFPSVQF